MVAETREATRKEQKLVYVSRLGRSAVSKSVIRSDCEGMVATMATGHRKESMWTDTSFTG